MNNTQTALEKITTPIGFSDTTGMNVYQSYTASSGFNYMIGVREIKDIIIVEEFTEGTACVFLCGIHIYHKQTKELLTEIEVKKSVRYTRVKVMEMVKESLLQVLVDACKKDNIDVEIDNLNTYLDDVLEKCYFERSRKAILSWAKTVGILKN